MADHFSGPRAIADPAADIADLYVFPSPERPGYLVLVLNVFPSAMPGALFSDALAYRFRLRPLMLAAGKRPAFAVSQEEYAFTCTFASPAATNGDLGAQLGACITPSGEQLAFRVGDEQGGQADRLRAYAGLRLDPILHRPAGREGHRDAAAAGIQAAGRQRPGRTKRPEHCGRGRDRQPLWRGELRRCSRSSARR